MVIVIVSRMVFIWMVSVISLVGSSCSELSLVIVMKLKVNYGIMIFVGVVFGWIFCLWVSSSDSVIRNGVSIIICIILVMIVVFVVFLLIVCLVVIIWVILCMVELVNMLYSVLFIGI